MVTDTGTTLSRRAASRLRDLMVAMGHPFDPLGGPVALAEILNVSRSQATHLLSGVVPWSLDDLASISTVFGKSPGYFLDPDSGRGIPADSSTVTSSDGGEATVWRAPSGFLSSDRVVPHARLEYMTTTSPGYFTPHPVRTMLVYESWREIDDAVPITPNHGYLLEDSDGRLEAMRCVRVVDGMGTFAGVRQLRKADEVTFPIAWHHNSNTGKVVVGKALGAIQGF